jgi:hypothetical protein
MSAGKVNKNKKIIFPIRKLLPNGLKENGWTQSPSGPKVVLNLLILKQEPN